MKYRIVNYVIIFFILYFFTLPVWTTLTIRIFPGAFVCQYRQMTGDPCPFCGITTDIDTMIRGKKDPIINPLTIPLGILLIVDLMYRLLMQFLFTSKTMHKFKRYDIVIHAGLFAVLVGYIWLAWV